MGRLQRRKIRPNRNIAQYFSGTGMAVLEGAVYAGMGIMLMDALL